MYRTTYESPVGPLTLVGDDEHLCGVWFNGQSHTPVHMTAVEASLKHSPILNAAILWFESYFAGHAPGPCPPIRTGGTHFQEEVWAHVRMIPYGELTTYGEIARRIAADRVNAGTSNAGTSGGRISARAVGAAVGRNPVSIIVPCHRVVAADGRLTGYSGGVERKAYLLGLEGVQIIGGPSSASARAFTSS